MHITKVWEMPECCKFKDHRDCECVRALSVGGVGGAGGATDVERLKVQAEGADV